MFHILGIIPFSADPGSKEPKERSHRSSPINPHSPTACPHVLHNPFPRLLTPRGPSLPRRASPAPPRPPGPTPSLNRTLARIFRTPSNIAARPLSRYKSPTKAVVVEGWRVEPEATRVVEHIVQRVERTAAGKVRGGGAVDEKVGKLVVVLKALHRLGSDLHGHNDLILRLAVTRGEKTLVGVLLDMGAEVGAGQMSRNLVHMVQVAPQQRKAYMLRSALVIAAESGNVEMMTLLLNRARTAPDRTRRLRHAQCGHRCGVGRSFAHDHIALRPRSRAERWEPGRAPPSDAGDGLVPRDPTALAKGAGRGRGHGDPSSYGTQGLRDASGG
ncbi:hypothetical protein HDU93_005475, partial [Gonapodya sp. JEL0774]